MCNMSIQEIKNEIADYNKGDIIKVDSKYEGHVEGVILDITDDEVIISTELGDADFIVSVDYEDIISIN